MIAIALLTIYLTGVTTALVVCYFHNKHVLIDNFTMNPFLSLLSWVNVFFVAGVAISCIVERDYDFQAGDQNNKTSRINKFYKFFNYKP